jgi:hypothetical protein
MPVPDISTELACGYQHVPFKAVAIDTTKFVSPEYLPEGFTMCDPRNMKKDAIRSFFTHIKERQDKQGAENSFRFKKALGKHHETVETHYPTGQWDQMQVSPRKQKEKEKTTTMVTESAQHRPARHTLAPHNPAPHASAPHNPAPQASAPLDPAPHTLAPHNPAPHASAPDGMAIINQAMMAQLLDRGYPSMAPVNGPHDGDPQYAVPVAELRRLNSLEVPAKSNYDSIPVDPALLPDRPVAPRPRYSRNTPATRSQTRTSK